MNIALLGYGKMGKAIESLALEAGDTVTLKVDIGNAASWTDADLKKADVAIEFSRPDSAVGNILRCFDAGVPIVVGTTGWLERLPEVKEQLIRKNGTLLHASNFSIGVNLFFELNKQLARLMARYPEYRHVFVHETHHVHKLDAPSGTAISIAEQIVERNEQYRDWTSIPYDHRAAADFGSGTLPVYHTRADEVPGTHSVTYASPTDEIEIRHLANNRDGFARGALSAARWLCGKKGYFTMEDYLQF